MNHLFLNMQHCLSLLFIPLLHHRILQVQIQTPRQVIQTPPSELKLQVLDETKQTNIFLIDLSTDFVSVVFLRLSFAFVFFGIPPFQLIEQQKFDTLEDLVQLLRTLLSQIVVRRSCVIRLADFVVLWDHLDDLSTSEVLEIDDD